MKKLMFAAVLLLTAAVASYAQDAVAEQPAERAVASADGLNDDGSLMKYRRSSLFSVLIQHPGFPYAEAIDSAFRAIPIPDKFNDHNLPMESRFIISSATKMKKGGKKKAATNQEDIDAFIADTHVPRELVAKWFDRDPSTGAFDMALIQERGFYDASQADIAAAGQTERNIAILGDAGEDLIGKTFMIVNDITFVDKGEQSKTAAGVISVLGGIAGRLLGSSAISDLGRLAATAVNEIDGFKVNITTYLYRLDWNDEIAGTFYKEYWYQGAANPARRAAFDASDIFKVTYVGETTTSAQNVSSKSFSKKSKDQQMLTVCSRAIDKAIVELQREYDEFKVNVPIYRINAEEKTVDVQIGLKEGLNNKSQYEVLMSVADENGHRSYKRVGLIKPDPDKIWDNRFGALEEAQALAQDAANGDAVAQPDEDGEEAAGEVSSNPKDKKAKKVKGEKTKGDPTLGATTFKIISGADKIMPGCLVREVTIKREG